MDAGHLGFSFRTMKTGDVAIRRGNLVVTRLHDAAARKFLSQIEGLLPAGQQQVMARVTGNYKRGNERAAARNSRQGAWKV